MYYPSPPLLCYFYRHFRHLGNFSLVYHILFVLTMRKQYGKSPHIKQGASELFGAVNYFLPFFLFLKKMTSKWYFYTYGELHFMESCRALLYKWILFKDSRKLLPWFVSSLISGTSHLETVSTLVFGVGSEFRDRVPGSAFCLVRPWKGI